MDEKTVRVALQIPEDMIGFLGRLASREGFEARKIGRAIRWCIREEMKREYSMPELSRPYVSDAAALVKILVELEFAVSQLQAPNDAKSASAEDRVQWAYRRGARDAYLEAIKALQEIKLT